MSECGEILMAGYSTVLDCVREPGHGGYHCSYGGSTWDADRQNGDQK